MNQPSLLTVATDSTAKLPSNENQWQAVRDNSPAGLGKYYAYNKNGVKEPIGGFGVNNFPFANDTNAGANLIEISIPGAPVFQDGYIFEVRILTSNTGDSTLNINGTGPLQVTNTDGNALVGGELINNEIYLFSYNATTGKYELLGLAKPSPTPSIPDTIETGTFHFDGTQTGVFVHSVSTLRKAKIIYISAARNNGGFFLSSSQGQGNLSVQSCLATRPAPTPNQGTQGIFFNQIVNLDRDLNPGSAGFDGVLTAINNTSFDITFTTKADGAMDCEFEWIAITGD